MATNEGSVYSIKGIHPDTGRCENDGKLFPFGVSVVALTAEDAMQRQTRIRQCEDCTAYYVLSAELGPQGATDAWREEGSLIS